MSVLATPPIVVDNRGELKLFDSVNEAELWMEAVDVRNNEHEVLDSTGLRLEPRVVSGRIETVRLSVPEPPVRDLERLRDVLFEFVVRTGKASPTQASEMPLGDLLALIKVR